MTAANFTFPPALVGGDSWNPPFHPVVQVFCWFVASLLSLETILGNAMVLLAYRLERSISKQLNNRFIVSLAISDLIIGIEGIPFFTVYVINGDRWPLGAVACETWLFLDYTLCLVSILTVLLITADRYLSVCHTASYLKWQSPLKIQLLIIGSWLLPALIFGIMIFGWPLIGGELERIQATSNGECYAPFLANPYVNMSMYLAYYWTTLVAMLILYKGIHKAAKKLEKRSRAREHRHIALLLTQRLGTQVGVGLMLHAKRYHEETMREKAAPIQKSEPPKDSGYITTNTLSTTDSSDRRRSSFGVLVKAVQTSQRIARFRGRGTTFAAFHSKNWAPKSCGRNDEKRENNTATHLQTNEIASDRLECLSEQNSGGSQALAVPSTATAPPEMARDHDFDAPIEQVDVPKPRGYEADDDEDDEGNCSLVADDEDEGDEVAKLENSAEHCRHVNDGDNGAIISLSTGAFNEESLSSVLRFNSSAMAAPLVDAGASDTTSQIIENNRKMTGETHEIGRDGSVEKIERNASSLIYNQRKRGSIPKTTGSLKERRSRKLRTTPVALPKSTAPSESPVKNSAETDEETAKRLATPNSSIADEQLQPTEASPRRERGSRSLEQLPPIKLSVHPPLTPSVQQKCQQRLSIQSAIVLNQHHPSSSTSQLGQPSPSRRTSRQPSTTGLQPGIPNGGADGDGGMLGRFFHRIHSWVRISMVGIGGIPDPEGNPGTNTDERHTSAADIMLPSFLRSSKSYSSMSSISSQTGGSRRHSSFLQTGPFSPHQIPTLTITSGSVWDSQEPQQQLLVVENATTGNIANNLQLAPEPMPFAEHVVETGGKRGSRLLNSVFAPISALQRRRKRTKAERRAHKAFRTITFIVGLFAILWSPYYVVATIYGFCHGQCIPAMLYNVSYYMCYLNSSLNPFAYALANRQFRSAFTRILRGNFRQL